MGRVPRVRYVLTVEDSCQCTIVAASNASDYIPTPSLSVLCNVYIYDHLNAYTIARVDNACSMCVIQVDRGLMFQKVGANIAAPEMHISTSSATPSSLDTQRSHPLSSMAESRGSPGNGFVTVTSIARHSATQALTFVCSWACAQDRFPRFIVRRLATSGQLPA